MSFKSRGVFVKLNAFSFRIFLTHTADCSVVVLVRLHTRYYSTHPPWPIYLLNPPALDDSYLPYACLRALFLPSFPFLPSFSFLPSSFPFLSSSFPSSSSLFALRRSRHNTVSFRWIFWIQRIRRRDRRDNLAVTAILIRLRLRGGGKHAAQEVAALIEFVHIDEREDDGEEHDYDDESFHSSWLLKAKRQAQRRHRVLQQRACLSHHLSFISHRPSCVTLGVAKRLLLDDQSEEAEGENGEQRQQLPRVVGAVEHDCAAHSAHQSAQQR